MSAPRANNPLTRPMKMSAPLQAIVGGPDKDEALSRLIRAALMYIIKVWEGGGGHEVGTTIVSLGYTIFKSFLNYLILIF